MATDPSEALNGVLPSGGSEGAVEPSNGGSEAHNEPATAPSPLLGEEIEQTVPQFAAELVLTSIGSWVQRLPDGGRQLKVAVAVQSPAGPQIQLPAYVIEFDADGWQTFRDLIERDGRPKPNIPIATRMPPGRPT